jgi:hypothetical protein
VETARIYPYVVPAAYVEAISPEMDGMALPLGHDVYAMLWEDCGGVSRNVAADELESAGLDPFAAQDVALENLHRVARSGAVRIGLMGTKTDDSPFIVWAGHWLAASCVRLPNLYAFACEQLHARDLCASIPQRETLVIFPNKGKPFRDQMRRIIRHSEAPGEKPITFELFSLTADGVCPFSEN